MGGEAAAKYPREGTCFGGTCMFKSCFSRATENSDWTDNALIYIGTSIKKMNE